MIVAVELCFAFPGGNDVLFTKNIFDIYKNLFFMYICRCNYSKSKNIINYGSRS